MAAVYGHSPEKVFRVLSTIFIGTQFIKNLAMDFITSKKV